jgi:DNA-directed RNA polymerase subunit alpha
MENILLPSSIQYKDGERPHEGILTVEPCFYGYGTTLGNALRRVLLSSLPGAAVTAVKIKGVNHEFQPVEGVKEDALEIILNVKSLRLKSHSEEPVKLKINVSGSKKVTAADIEANADVEIMNKDLLIATVTDDATTFDMELTIQRGRGYSPSEERKENLDLGTIAIDALFSPVRNVGYRVEPTRVGEITNYDRLIMTIETDGTVTPQEAVDQSSKMLIDYFSILTNNTASSEPMAAPVESVEPAESTEE